ncbi:MAG: hypothetical protein QGG36_08765 [Pirellulaceae bacterium]|jgi:ATP-dependent DNA ligase|nr:hypothetical protein [Pirellulaceae bacterium]
MKVDKLVDPSRVEIKLGEFGVAPATALTDIGMHALVQDFRRQTGLRMYPLAKEDVRKKLPEASYHVSRKIDGEFTVAAYRDGQIVTVNPGGSVRTGMPWQQDAAELFEKAGYKEAMIAGELYVAVDEDRRPRVHDVTSTVRQPQSKDDLDRIRFAAFDIVRLDEKLVDGTFDERWAKLTKIFPKEGKAHIVQAQQVSDSQGVHDLFEKWVEGEGAEGVVVRSDLAGLFKVKPQHTLDLVVVGFTESVDDRQGMLHDLLTAVVRRDGAMHLLCKVGGGFDDEQRRNLLSDLKDLVVESDYTEVNSDHVAYQMVRPEMVIEITCLDLVSQTTRGGPVNRMVVRWNNDESKYEILRRMPLASVISPQFVRIREDKRPHPDDVRIDQVADLVEVAQFDIDAGSMTLPKSEILRREVYTKQLKGANMVRKLVMWKTNKEQESEDYSAFVIHYTDFSPNRKEPLQRDIRVSNSQEQIEAMWVALKEANIKKGWSEA